MAFSKNNKKRQLKKIFHSHAPKRTFRERNALQFLNVTQFFGALNDNVYKFLSVFLLIDIKGVSHSSEILFWVGIICVLPFLLFSTSGGIFADRFSKQKIIVAMKLFEVFITIGAILSFAYRSPFGIYSMLFLLSAQSAIFGPPKYSIIPELVKPNRIAKANGLITSSTYLAIILGSFLASFITQLSGKNFVATAIFCLVVAIIGYVASIFIPKTTGQRQKQKINPIFIKDIVETLRFCKGYKFFHLAMSGSFFFLFMGGFLQLNIVPFGIESLGLTEVEGGYLFLSGAIGIALGAFVAGRTSQKKGNLGLSCLAIGISAISFFLLPLATFSLPLTLAALVLLGFGGGMFIVPIDSFIQAYSPDDRRGKIVATSNFLGFCGVLLAPICIYLFNGYMTLSAASSFFVIGLLSLVYFCFLARKLSGIFLNYASRKLLYPFFHVEMSPANFDIKSIKSLIVPTPHISYAALIMGIRTKFHLYIAKPKREWKDFVWKLFKNVHFIYFENSPKFIEESFHRVLKLNRNDNIVPCLIVTPSNSPYSHYSVNDYLKLKQRFQSLCQFVTIREKKKQAKKIKRMWKPVFVTLDFEAKKLLLADKSSHLLSGIYSKV